MSKRLTRIQIKALNIPLEQVEEYKEVFDILDKNNIGKISSKDIIKINKIFNYPINNQIIDEKIRKIKVLKKKELFFDEFVSFMENQKKIIKEMTENEFLGNKRRRDKFNVIQDEKSTEYTSSIKEENTDEDDSGFNLPKSFSTKKLHIKNNIRNRYKKNYTNNFIIEIDKNKINYNQIIKEINNEKMNENKKERSKRKKSKNNLEIKNNNIIINKKDIFSESIHKMRSKRNIFDYFTPVKEQSKNEIFYDSSAYKINNGFYSPTRISKGLNSRLGQSPTFSVKKKNKNFVNYSSERLLEKIKIRLNESNNKTNKDNKKIKKNKKNNEQINNIQKIVNNNFYGFEENNKTNNNIYDNNLKLNQFINKNNSNGNTIDDHFLSNKNKKKEKSKYKML